MVDLDPSLQVALPEEKAGPSSAPALELLLWHWWALTMARAPRTYPFPGA